MCPPERPRNGISTYKRRVPYPERRRLHAQKSTPPAVRRRIGSLTETSVPSTEALQAVSAKASHGGLNGSKRFFVGGMALRIELVGVADDLLFERLGQEVFVGQRQMLRNNLLLREARTGMAFANAGMLRIAFAAQYLGADAAMAASMRNCRLSCNSGWRSQTNTARFMTSVLWVIRISRSRLASG